MNNQLQKTLELQKLMRDPAAILSLLAEIERLSSACSRADEVISTESKAAAIATGRANLLETERDKLKSELAGLRTGYDAQNEVIAQLKAENGALRKALLEASEEIYAWGSYASDYFQEKHDLHGCVKKFHAAAISKGEQP